VWITDVALQTLLNYFSVSLLGIQVDCFMTRDT